MNGRTIKGTHGYIDKKKKRLLLTLIAFGSGIAIMYVTGYLLKGTRNNLCTVLAILTVLPAAKVAVAWIMLFSHHSREKEEYDAIKCHAKEALMLTELILTSKERVMPTPYAVIADGNICAYTDQNKYDPAYAEKFLTENLKENGLKVNVKIFQDKSKFLRRVDHLASMTPDEERKKKDERIRILLLTLSL